MSTKKLLFATSMGVLAIMLCACGGKDNNKDDSQAQINDLSTQVAGLKQTPVFNSEATRSVPTPINTVFVPPTLPPPTATPAPPPGTFRSSDGVYELKLEATTWGGVYSEGGYDWKPMVRFNMRYYYHGTEQHFLRYAKTNFRLRDDLGNEYKITGDLYLVRGAGQYQGNLGGTMDGNTNEAVFILPFGGEGTSGQTTIAAGARSVTLSVDNFNLRIPHAEWKIQIP